MGIRSQVQTFYCVVGAIELYMKSLVCIPRMIGANVFNDTCTFKISFCVVLFCRSTISYMLMSYIESVKSPSVINEV